MKKKILQILFLFSIILFMGCEKSIVEPTLALKPVNAPTTTKGKVEIYNHIGNQGAIRLYINGDFITSLPNYFSSTSNFDCGYSTNTLAVYTGNNLEEGSYYYEIRNSNGVPIISNYFYISRGNCTPINLFY
ncbi:MAG: hypothetical protein WCI53_12380 [Bacteroidota bacterium]